MNSFLLISGIVLIVCLANSNAFPQWYAQFTASRPHDQSSVRVCGQEAEEFLQWFCIDPTFKLPYEYHLGPIIRKYGILGDPETDPFYYQAAKCCHHTCKANEFRWMCTYHKKFTNCRENHSIPHCHNKVIVEMRVQE